MICAPNLSGACLDAFLILGRLTWFVFEGAAASIIRICLRLPGCSIHVFAVISVGSLDIVLGCFGCFGGHVS